MNLWRWPRLWLALALLAGDLAAVCAENEPHWAFVVPARPAVPEIPAVANPIDRFIRARLAAEGIEPALPAARSTLIRRLSFDLRGVPPTPAEVAAFEKDASQDAFEQLVDRYLASPQFGERMAQDWLDLARYADTSGYAADRTREIWVYRDWVIDAINANMPFDQFTIEQLAGDLLPNATQEQRVATGFHRNAMQAKGNNPRKEEFRVKGIVDRLTATGRTWLGLTLECAECHDHKFDPVSQREYYQLFAIFNNVPHLGEGYDTHGPRMSYGPPEAQRAQLASIATRIETLTGRLRSPEHESQLGRWAGAGIEQDASQFNPEGDFTASAFIQTEAPVGDIVSNNDWRAGDRGFVFGIGGEAESEAPAGHLFAWVSAKREPFDGLVIYGSQPVNDGRRHHVAVVFRTGKGIQLYVDGVADSNAKVTGKAPSVIAKSTRRLAIGSGYNKSPEPTAYRFDGALEDVRLYASALEHPAGRNEAIATLVETLGKKLWAARVESVEVPVMEELPEARETYVHLRGDFKSRGERVQPGVPKALPPLPEEVPVDRLAFARWLVAPEHPLTARVAANYLWQHFFATGIVATPGDFGARGAAPTHPQLLDWLATEFVASGWDRKHLVRLMVTSQTYQQSSAMSERGSDSALLARMPRRRLAAEQIRDAALAVSGLLVQRLGGPSVFPLQPDGYYEERGQNTAGNSNFTWVASTGDARHRKTLYTYWKRMALHPSLAALDAPPRQVCIVRRSQTNTPQQALVLLNDPMFHECAEAFGARILAQGARLTDGERIRYAYRCCLGREPDANELARCLAFIALPDTSWTAFAAALLNLDEALTRE